MECLSPILSNTTVHGRIWLPCSKCIACKQRIGREWFIRLKKHYEAQKNPSYFVTLTYSDENLPYDSETGVATFRKEQTQKFVKQIRNYSTQGVPKNVKIKNLVIFTKKGKLSYFNIAERGDLFGRPHYHVIIFNVPFNKENFSDIVSGLWPYGRTDVGDVNDKSICYITDYMVTKDNENTEWRTMSKGLGSDYIKTHEKYHKSKLEFKVPVHDKSFNMPRYFRKKIFSDSDRKAIGKTIQKELIEKNSGTDYHTDLQNRINALENKIKFKKEKRMAQKFNKYPKL